ncbi:pro-kumamolisin, activation domain-containing protein [Sarocladium implicatum]|nr:pro-kumamolisin, activation domain-containing protein [Sarocladium implicatum]
MKFSTGVSSWLCLGAATAAVVVEQIDKLPQGWRRLDGKPSPDEPIRLSVALRQPAIDDVEKTMAQKNAEHLTREEARLLQQPCPRDIAAVMGWLESYGITDAHTDEDFVRVKTTVRVAEQLLDADIESYTFEDKKPVRRTQRYSVPDEVAEAIAFVHPIANFMSPKKQLSRPSPNQDEDESELQARDSPCARQVTPECIRELYGFDNPVTDNDGPIVRFGIAGFLEENANYDDALTFLKRNSPEIAATGYNFSTDLINGAVNEQNPAKAGAEAALDMQYAMPLGYPSNITYHLAAGRGVQLNDSGEPTPDQFVTNEPYLEFLQHFLNKPDDEIPHVLSISYADDELSVPRPYAKRVCAMFGLLTARGTSVLVGSGDGGARGARDSSCIVNDGSGRKAAMVTFPGTCPWVTAVGAVTNKDPLTGADFSTGGFSQYFRRPYWQDDAVEGYVKALDGRLKGLYDCTMRAIPDISAVGTRFRVLVARQVGLLDGTSASTPVMASMIALVNQERFKQGKRSLGWLNKVLYSEEMQGALMDVTNGTSESCVFGDEKPGGWPAEEGWDAITGLGVPESFQKLLDVLIDA